MDRRVLEILTNKPEIITGFPGWMLPESRIKQLRETVGLAVVEIAGRDSIAAAILATKLRDIEAILPTINFTGTEFGNWNEPFEKVELLRHAVGKKGIKVFRTSYPGSTSVLEVALRQVHIVHVKEIRDLLTMRGLSPLLPFNKNTHSYNGQLQSGDRRRT